MRNITRRICLFFCCTLCVTIFSSLVEAQTETVIYNFTNLDDLSFFPTAGITFDQQGRIYGTASGDDQSRGAVYRLVHEGGGWVYSPLHIFGYHVSQDGEFPLARVVFGPDGVLYGTTSAGGSTGHGIVFSLQPPATVCKTSLCPWLETILYSFSGGTDGSGPDFGDLVFDQAGNVYGTTYRGGSFGDGVVFKLTRSGGGWTESVLWSFTDGSDGANPYGGVIFDSAGNLYGATQGAVYELSPGQSGWTETTLYSFTDPANGSGSSGLTWDGQGDLFGITGGGEDGNNSVIYELTPQTGSWTFNVLQNVSSQGGAAPVSPPTFDSQGNLYGPLPSYPDKYGEVFELTHSGNQWVYSPVYQFTGCYGQAYPTGVITLDASGNLYGTTEFGGSGCAGTVWEITP